MTNLIRVTMFKIPEANVSKAIELYRVLSSTAVKDGKSYILSLHAGPAHPDPRSQGFNFIAKSEFASHEDMKYYDQGCEAHAILKKGMALLDVGGFMMVYYTPEIVKLI